MPFQVSLLGRAERLVKQDFGGTRVECQHLDLVGLAGPNEQCSIRRPALAGHAPDRLKASRLREQTEFLKISIKIGKTQINPYKKGERLCCHRYVAGTQLVGASSDSPVEKLTARPGTMVEIACL